MMVLGVIREEAFLALIRARSIAVWELVRPFIHQKRATNPHLGPEFMAVIEALSRKAATIGPEVGQRILGEWLAQPVGRR